MNDIEELVDLSVLELIDRYEYEFGKAPRQKSKAALIRKIAWKLQEDRLGGLSRLAQRKLDDLIANLDLGLSTKLGPLRSGARKRSDPIPGTTLIRQWKDKQIVVEVRQNGFEFNGAIYRSLSAIAGAITGAHWNGRLFFGLTKRKRKA